jgi:hypothetical protein
MKKIKIFTTGSPVGGKSVTDILEKNVNDFIGDKNIVSISQSESYSDEQWSLTVVVYYIQS